MIRKRSFLVSMLALGFVHAYAEPPEAPAPPAQHDAVLALIPTDAWLIVYTADLDRPLTHPLLKVIGGESSGLPEVLEAVTGALDGSFALSVGGAPVNPFSWKVTLAAQVSLERDELFRRFTDELVPRWNEAAVTRGLGELQFVEIDRVGQLTLVGTVPLSMTLAQRDGVLFGSSDSAATEAWLEERYAPASFVDGEAFARLIAPFPAPMHGLIYLDLRLLMPLAAMALDSRLPDLSKALQLDNLLDLALITSQTNRKKTPRPESPSREPDRPVTPPPSGALELRLAVGVRAIEPGPWHLIASSPGDASLAEVFPSDTTLLIHGSMKRATGLVADLTTLAAAIDPVIVDEYETERADFKRDVGFDPHSEFLANFVDAWAFGCRLERQQMNGLLYAVRLEDPKTFRKHMSALRRTFQLDIASDDYRGVPVHRALRPERQPPQVEMPTIDQMLRSESFSYAVVDNVLLLAPEAETLTAAIDAVLDGTGLGQTELFKQTARRVTPETSKLIYVNLGRLLEAEWTPKERAAAPPALRALVDAPSAVAAAIVPHEGFIALDFVTRAETDDVVTSVVATMVTESLKRAQVLSARLVSTSRIKGLLVACLIHANEHKDQWPTSLTTLVRDGSVLPQMLVSPYGFDSGRGQPYYLYRRPDAAVSTAEISSEIVVCEPEVHDGGAVFGFRDGHVEWITSPRAQELLAGMHSGR